MAASYLAADRSDIRYAAGQACRKMSNPTKASSARLERLARYLIGVWRVLMELSARFGQQTRKLVFNCFFTFVVLVSLFFCPNFWCAPKTVVLEDVPAMCSPWCSSW